MPAPPSLDFLLGGFTRLAVPFLDQAGELGCVTFNLVELIVCQFAPLFLGVTFELLPFAFENVLVHEISPDLKVHVHQRFEECSGTSEPAPSCSVFVSVLNMEWEMPHKAGINAEILP
jgi:hypothetical protein